MRPFHKAIDTLVKRLQSTAISITLARSFFKKNVLFFRFSLFKATHTPYCLLIFNKNSMAFSKKNATFMKCNH